MFSRLVAIINGLRLNLLSKRNTMDITSKNFNSELPYIQESIDKAIFMSIDGEFTGLSLPNQSLYNLDTLDERYDKIRASTGKFLMMQFGLCTFHYDAQKKCYANRAFNFYLWPKPSPRLAPDTRFMCQASSIDFLTQHNFDFNKVFREGIPYLRQDDETKLRIALEARQAFRGSNHSMSATSLNSSLNKILLRIKMEIY